MESRAVDDKSWMLHVSTDIIIIFLGDLVDGPPNQRPRFSRFTSFQSDALIYKGFFFVSCWILGLKWSVCLD